MRIVSPSGPLGTDLHPADRPASGLTLDRQVAVDRRRASAHRLEPEVAGTAGRGIKPAAIVGDLEQDTLRAVFDSDDRRFRVRVLDDVGESLAADREQLLLRP